MREDMPSSELAEKWGKELEILPPLGAFYLQKAREYWGRERSGISAKTRD